MVITDLKKDCRRCNGRGTTAGLNAMGISQINFSRECPDCKGVGFFLTELGQDVVEMLRPFITKMVQEMLGRQEVAQEESDEDDQGEHA